MSIPNYSINYPIVNVNVSTTSKVVFLPPASTVIGNSFLIRDITGYCSLFSSIFISTTGLDTIDINTRTVRLTSSLQSARFIVQNNSNYATFQNYKAGYSPFQYSFQPTQYSDCILWFDASQRNTISLQGGQSNLISTWSNLGTQTAASIQADGSNSGLTGVDTINNLNVVKIDVNKYMIASASIPSTETTSFIVFQSLVNQINLNNQIISFLDPTQSNAFQLNVNINQRNYYYQLNKTNSWTMNAGTSTNPYQLPQVISFRNTVNLATNFIHIDGYNLTLTSNAVANGFNSNILSYYLNGKNTSSGNSIDMAEIIVYSRALSDREVVLVEKYLKLKWGPQYAPAATFTPLDIANCSIWLDAVDADTLTSNVSGSVTAWRNKGTLGSSMIQVPTKQVPTTGTHTINGNNVLWFNSFQSLYNTNSFAFTNQEFTFFIATTTIGNLVTQNYTSWFVTLASGGFGAAANEYLGQYYVGCGANGIDNYVMNVSSSYPQNVPVIYSIRSSSNTTTNELRLNGVKQSLAFNKFAGYTITAQVYYTHYFGHSSSIDIGEILIYNRALSDAEVTRVQNYLSGKWGIS